MFRLVLIFGASLAILTSTLMLVFLLMDVVSLDLFGEVVTRTLGILAVVTLAGLALAGLGRLAK